MVIVHTFIKALTRAGRFIAQLEYFMDLIGDNLLFFPNEIPTYREILNTTMERCVTYLHSSGDFPVGRKIKGEIKRSRKTSIFLDTSK
jgi:hypothetical protein